MSRAARASRLGPAARAAHALEQLDPPTREATVRWWPDKFPGADAPILREVLPEVQGHVAMAGPKDPKAARRYLLPTAMITVWGYKELGDHSAEAVLCPHNVELWTMEIVDDKTLTWRQSSRWLLRRVGRAANPGAWQPPPIESPLAEVARAYDQAEEEAFCVAAEAAGLKNTAARLWLLAAALGAGLNGPEAGRAGPADLVAVGEGRLAVAVKGPRARLAPIRAAYTEAARQAAAGASGRDRFISGEGRNSAYKIAERLTVTGLGPLSFSRCRATWLTAHLVAGTPLAALRAIAGPVSARTLNPLLDAAAASLDPRHAAEQGLMP